MDYKLVKNKTVKNKMVWWYKLQWKMVWLFWLQFGSG